MVISIMVLMFIRSMKWRDEIVKFRDSNPYGYAVQLIINHSNDKVVLSQIDTIKYIYAYVYKRVFEGCIISMFPMAVGGSEGADFRSNRPNGYPWRGLNVLYEDIGIKMIGDAVKVWDC